MKKLITIGIAALLLGLVLSVPLRVNALEEEENIVGGAVTQPRSGLLSALALGISAGLLGAFLGLVAGVIVMLALGLIGVVLGLFITAVFLGALGAFAGGIVGLALGLIVYIVIGFVLMFIMR